MAKPRVDGARPVALHVGIDWAYRRAAWCALSARGEIVDEGAVAADEDGLARLVIKLGTDVRACVEMMSGAIWVRDQLAAAGWRVQIAHARKVRDIAPLACKTDNVDARVLAELCRRDLVPELWIPSLDDRALQRAAQAADAPRSAAHLGEEPDLRAAHPMGAATVAAATARTGRARAARRSAACRRWRDSIAEALAVIDLLDARIAPVDRELRPFAAADPRVIAAGHDPRRSGRCSA